jgi:hypothetical protein
MIYLGRTKPEKIKIIKELLSNNSFDKVYMLTHDRFSFEIPGVEVVTYKDLIQYAYYYRIIENTTSRSLIILNEILRDTNRNNLTFNCIRTFQNNTDNILIFNYLPIIENAEDFCALFDFETKTKYKYNDFENIPLHEASMDVLKVNIEFDFISVPLDLFFEEKYKIYKEKVFEKFDKKDPNVIPRDLQLFASKPKEKAIQSGKKYICRNSRIKGANIFTYRKAIVPGEYIVFDVPFNMIDFCDFLFESEQTRIPVLTSDLPVENYFNQKLINLKNNLDYVYSKIHR